MNITDVASLETRVHRLERQSRLLVIVLGLLAAAIVGTILKDRERTSSAKEVKSRNFVLLDAQGKVRGTWGLENGEVVLSFGESPQFSRVIISTTANGAEIGLRSPSHYPLSTWSVDSSNGVYLSMLEPNTTTPGDALEKLQARARRAGSSRYVYLTSAVEPRLLLNQYPVGTVELSAGYQDIAKYHGPNLNFFENDQVRLTLGRSFWNTNQWAGEFRDATGQAIYRIPPPAPLKP
jgi:hypothetical protein